MKKILALALACLMLVALLVGCASGNTDTTANTDTTKPAESSNAASEGPSSSDDNQTAANETPAALSGTVTTDGSTSMEKVIGSLGEAFTAANTDVKFTYNPTGSGSGITAVSEGRCDIGLSSRALKEEELSQGLKGETLCLDGIAIIVNPENPVEDLTIEQIADIYTGKITNWADVGGNDAEIVLIGREAGSGTRDGFESITGTADACQYRQELTSTGDVITTVSQNPDAIGYASLASVAESVKALKVGGVTPTEETVKDGSYAIQRPFVLVTKEGAELSAAAQAFYDYAMSPDAGEIIANAGAVPIN